jgi:hypothetical protein
VSLPDRLRGYGLYLRGVARLTAEEIEQHEIDPGRPVIALVGNVGSSYWPNFSESAEYLDNAADPLDRWSRRIAEAVAAEFPVTPLYPFEGPPYYPFQRWAQRAEALEQSPVGVMMDAPRVRALAFVSVRAARRRIRSRAGAGVGYISLCRMCRQTLPAAMSGRRVR